ncbi:C-5 cytosine-specific DNA methylase, partial [Popillia japonica]
MSLKFIDFFAGSGGFRRGMELAGHKCVGFCELDKHAVMSYTMMHLATEDQRKYIEDIPAPLKKDGKRNLKQKQSEVLKEEYKNGEWYSNDITAVDARSIPSADIWCFGAPCQDFSIAGKRAGLGGDRSCLVREVFRLIKDTPKECRPKYLVYENVKGMLSSNNGWDFACINTEMESLGYDIEYQLLNSKDFGVPQNRERVFVVGHFRGRCTGKVFPVSGATSENNVKKLGNVNPSGNGMNGNVFEAQGLAPTLTTNKGEGNKVAIPVLTPDRAEKRQNGRRFKENGEPMFTLTSQDRHGVVIGTQGRANKKAVPKHDNLPMTFSGFRIRRLTPKECFRLQ